MVDPVTPPTTPPSTAPSVTPEAASPTIPVSPTTSYIAPSPVQIGANIVVKGLEGFLKGLGVNAPGLSVGAPLEQQRRPGDHERRGIGGGVEDVDVEDFGKIEGERAVEDAQKEVGRTDTKDTVKAIQVLDKSFLALAEYVKTGFGQVRIKFDEHAEAVTKVSRGNQHLIHELEQLSDRLKRMELQSIGSKKNGDEITDAETRKKIAALEELLKNIKPGGGGLDLTSMLTGAGLASLAKALSPSLGALGAVGLGGTILSIAAFEKWLIDSGYNKKINDYIDQKFIEKFPNVAKAGSAINELARNNMPSGGGGDQDILTSGQPIRDPMWDWLTKRFRSRSQDATRVPLPQPRPPIVANVPFPQSRPQRQSYGEMNAGSIESWNEGFGSVPQATPVKPSQSQQQKPWYDPRGWFSRTSYQDEVTPAGKIRSSMEAFQKSGIIGALKNAGYTMPTFIEKAHAFWNDPDVVMAMSTVDPLQIQGVIPDAAMLREMPVDAANFLVNWKIRSGLKGDFDLTKAIITIGRKIGLNLGGGGGTQTPFRPVGGANPLLQKQPSASSTGFMNTAYDPMEQLGGGRNNKYPTADATKESVLIENPNIDLEKRNITLTASEILTLKAISEVGLEARSLRIESEEINIDTKRFVLSPEALSALKTATEGATQQYDDTKPNLWQKFKGWMGLGPQTMPSGQQIPSGLSMITQGMGITGPQLEPGGFRGGRLPGGYRGGGGGMGPTGEQSPEGKLPGIDLDRSGGGRVDPRMQRIVSEGARMFMEAHPEYGIRTISGYRPGGYGLHSGQKMGLPPGIGGAEDIEIYDKRTGRALPKQGRVPPEVAKLYMEYQNYNKVAQEALFPQFNVRSGGFFKSGVPLDWMHTDFGDFTNPNAGGQYGSYNTGLNAEGAAILGLPPGTGAMGPKERAEIIAKQRAAGMLQPSKFALSQQQLSRQPMGEKTATAMQTGSGGKVDPQDLYKAAVNKIANSSLNGYVPPDGAKWGITTGSPQEWARFYVAIARQESGFNPMATNLRDPGGSFGLFQFNQSQFGLRGNAYDPNASLDAMINATVYYMGKGQGIAGMGETFGSIRRPHEVLQHMPFATSVGQSVGYAGPQAVGPQPDATKAMQTPTLSGMPGTTIGGYIDRFIDKATGVVKNWLYPPEKSAAQRIQEGHEAATATKPEDAWKVAMAAPLQLPEAKVPEKTAATPVPQQTRENWEIEGRKRQKNEASMAQINEALRKNTAQLQPQETQAWKKLEPTPEQKAKTDQVWADVDKQRKPDGSFDREGKPVTEPVSNQAMDRNIKSLKQEYGPITGAPRHDPESRGPTPGSDGYAGGKENPDGGGSICAI